MTAPEPTQPLTDERLASIRDAVERRADHFSDRKLLLAEVDRLRHENEYHQRYRYTAEQNAHDTARENRTLRSHLDNFRTLEDRIPDDTNGERMLGWDKGWNAARSEVRKLAALALDQSGEGQTNG